MPRYRAVTFLGVVMLLEFITIDAFVFILLGSLECILLHTKKDFSKFKQHQWKVIKASCEEH